MVDISRVRDEFSRGGGGGGGGAGLKSLARILIPCLYSNQVVLPEYYLFFCPKIAILQI